MRVVIVLLAVSLAAVAAIPTRQSKIVGGSLTTINQYPTITALLYAWDGSTFWQSCGGTILTTKTILTAAHCPYGDVVSRWRVRVGSSYANSGGTVHALSHILIHPNYNPRNMDSDVALLYTSSKIEYSNVVRAASIAGTNYNLVDNQIVWAAGWGTTTTGGAASEQLRHVQIWTVNQDICRSRYSYEGATINDNMLCSGYLDVGGRDQCQGDSGGPLYHNGVVVGVCSWGRGCALAQFPGVNARISRFTTWIQSNA